MLSRRLRHFVKFILVYILMGIYPHSSRILQLTRCGGEGGDFFQEFKVALRDFFFIIFRLCFEVVLKLD